MMQTVVVLESHGESGEVFLVPNREDVTEIVHSLPGNLVRGFSSPVGVRSVFSNVRLYWTPAAIKLRDSELAVVRARRETRTKLLERLCKE